MLRFPSPVLDEGYSEHPLATTPTSASSLKFARAGLDHAASSTLTSRLDLPAWLTDSLAKLSVQDKAQITMALLNDLPTDVISEIVHRLTPRLNIDFIRYLPPEICLKILGFLDPVALANVAKACRSWHSLALDRKLWQHLYEMEGWKPNMAEINACEEEMNSNSNSDPYSLARGSATSALADGDEDDEDDYPARKRRAVAVSQGADADMAAMSIFGDPKTNDERSYKGKGVETAAGRMSVHKGKEVTSVRNDTRTLLKQTLWLWDSIDRRFKMNWKYLYSARRRLEANWELGRYVNFQFPHPNHAEETHQECVYSLQYNAQWLVTGSRDRTIRIWNMASRRLVRVLCGHAGSVLCLQFDPDPNEDIIVSGSSDSRVIIWRFSTGLELQTLSRAHRESVLNVRFDKRILATCSKDKTIKIFNRRQLNPGDLGWRDEEGRVVDPASIVVTDYGIGQPSSLGAPIPAWTLIGILQGHGAAVNAVQICDTEIVSASGDRQVKIWDWTNESCTKTIVAHSKGIACVQYDGRRIVTGSSDNEVKVFDRISGLEVASLTAHTALVRTVQAGFADLPDSPEVDAAEARRVDHEFFRALEEGRLAMDGPAAEGGARRPRRWQGNAGSKRPERITAFGAKLPPGGGGGRFGRIVSGSYDMTVIVWRRDKGGEWKPRHTLKQEEAAERATRTTSTRHVRVPAGNNGSNAAAAAAAALSLETPALAVGLHPSMRSNLHPSAAATAGPEHNGRLGFPMGSVSARRRSSASASPRPYISLPPALAGERFSPTLPQPPQSPHAAAATLHLPQDEASGLGTLPLTLMQRLHEMIDNLIELDDPYALAHALEAHPTLLTRRAYLQVAVDRHSSPLIRSQLRQVLSTAVIRNEFERQRLRREALRNLDMLRTPQSGEGSMVLSQALDQLAGGGEGARVSRPPTPGSSSNPHRDLGQASSSAAQQPVQPALGNNAAPAAASAPAPVPDAHPAQRAHQQPPPFPQLPRQAGPHGARHPHAPADGQDSPARVFKLQYDARRILCCSQSSVIVGWDFCNGDPDLIEASRFFEVVE